MCFFFFNDTATTEIYTLSLHDALPIYKYEDQGYCWVVVGSTQRGRAEADPEEVPKAIAYYKELERRSTLADRKSTRLNSSHANISYAVFCLKKKKHTLYTRLAPGTSTA